MRKQAQIVSEVIKSVVEKAGVGINLEELEKVAEDKIKELGATSANLNYQPSWAQTPFPSVICLNVNDVIAHAPPRDYVLQDGDLLNIDCGIKYKGLCGDAATTIGIGKISDRDQRLLTNAKRALYQGIDQVRAGVKVSEIGHAIYWFAKKRGFVVNRNFFGHTIGKEMHGGLAIPHYDMYPVPEGIATLEEGEVICLEPMLTYKDEYGVRDKDGWTVRTSDGRNSCMFEEMIEICKDGYKILTTHLND